ncbi:TetR family transcriptional regulator [Xylophilus sp. Kf1]|nr:TetR family transcriptional regulator [Xylophilus sp. Kf1]
MTASGLRARHGSSGQNAGLRIPVFLHNAFVTSTPPPEKPPRRRQVDRSTATRGLLLDTALALVSEKGVDRATILEVALRAGMTAGAVQHHFPSKAHLMVSLVEHILSQRIAQGGVWPDASEPLRRRADLFIHALWERSYSTPRFIAAWNLYLRLTDDEATRGDLALRRRQAGEQLRIRFLEVFPEMPPGAESETFLQLTTAVLRGLGIQRVFGTLEASEKAQLAMLVDLLVQRCRADR